MTKEISLPQIRVDLQLPDELKVAPPNQDGVECMISGCKGSLRFGPQANLRYPWYGAFDVTVTGLHGWGCSNCGARLTSTRVGDLMVHTVNEAIQRYIRTN